jgi:ferredoxin
MKKIECPSCAMKMDAGQKACPVCNYEFPRQSPWLQWVAILLVIVILLAYIL